MAIYCGEFLGTFLLVFFGTSTVATRAFQCTCRTGAGSRRLGAGRDPGHLCHPAPFLRPPEPGGLFRHGPGREDAARPSSALLGPLNSWAPWPPALSRVLLLLNSSIAGYEAAAGIVRGTPESVRTAMLFGEYFPNPGFPMPWFEVSLGTAMLVEGFGTFLLVTMIFLLTEGCNVGRPSDGSAPIFIWRNGFSPYCRNRAFNPDRNQPGP